MITIGIDPHKASHTAVALDPEGRVLGELRAPATRTTTERLLHWAERWPERIWAVEGASGLGRLLAQQLTASDETALDVLGDATWWLRDVCVAAWLTPR